MKKLFLIILFALSISNSDLTCMPQFNWKNITLATIGTSVFVNYCCKTIQDLKTKKSQLNENILNFFKPFEGNFKYSLNKVALGEVQEKIPNPLTCIYKIIETPLDLFNGFKKYKAKKASPLKSDHEKSVIETQIQNEFVSTEKKFNWNKFNFGIARAALVFKYANNWLQKKLGLDGSDLASIVTNIGVKCIIPSITDILQDKIAEKMKEKCYFITSVENLRKDGGEAKIGYNLFELGTMICPFSNTINLWKNLEGSFNIFSKFTRPILSTK